MDWNDLPQINIPDDAMGPTKKFRRQIIDFSCQGKRRRIGRLLFGNDGSLYFFPKWKSAVIQIGNATQKDGKLIKSTSSELSSLPPDDRTGIHLSLHPSGQVHVMSSNRKQLTVAQIGPWLPVRQPFVFAHVYTESVGMLPEVRMSGPATEFGDPKKSLRLDIIICPLNEKAGQAHVPFHHSTIYIGLSPRYAVLLNATAIPPCEPQFFFLTSHQGPPLEHAEITTKDSTADNKETTSMGKSKGILIKKSKVYDDKPFTYWWDISPNLERLSRYQTVEFVCRDTRRRCNVPVEQLKPFLTEKRRTTRGKGNWGVQVLKKVGYEDKLAFEPGRGRNEEWLYLPVVWT
jgi:hypothetical protein